MPQTWLNSSTDTVTHVGTQKGKLRGAPEGNTSWRSSGSGREHERRKRSRHPQVNPHRKLRVTSTSFCWSRFISGSFLIIYLSSVASCFTFIRSDSDSLWVCGVNSTGLSQSVWAVCAAVLKVLWGTKSDFWGGSRFECIVPFPWLCVCVYSGWENPPSWTDMWITASPTCTGPQ